MDDLIGFWMCSCCKQVYHSDIEQPVNQFGNDDFECALCDVSNIERKQVNFKCLNAQFSIRMEH